MMAGGLSELVATSFTGSISEALSWCATWCVWQVVKKTNIKTQKSMPNAGGEEEANEGVARRPLYDTT